MTPIGGVRPLARSTTERGASAETPLSRTADTEPLRADEPAVDSVAAVLEIVSSDLLRTRVQLERLVRARRGRA